MFFQDLFAFARWQIVPLSPLSDFDGSAILLRLAEAMGSLARHCPITRRLARSSTKAEADLLHVSSQRAFVPAFGMTSARLKEEFTEEMQSAPRSDSPPAGALVELKAACTVPAGGLYWPKGLGP
jgi:hypothetical protein